MNRFYTLLFILTLPFIGTDLFAQGTITGRVVNESGQPVEIAAVYINGTTLRTSTTPNGSFELKGLTFPCQVVVSHLGFETLKLKLEEQPNKPLLLYLIEKDVKLSEVSVEGTDKRKQLTDSFKDYFLGWDTWGRSSIILNEKALTYNVSYNEDTIRSTFSGDLSQPNLPRSIIDRTLIINAKEPLQIDLPLLGYTLTVDLDFFSLIKTKPYFNPVTGLTMERFDVSRYMGSFFVTPYKNVSKSKQNRFERNRKEAYYNSTMHFCKSLYWNELLKNGYVFINKYRDPISKEMVYDWVNLDSCYRFDKNGNLQIIGLAGKSFEIHYVGKSNGTPINLSGKSYRNPVDYVNRNRMYYNVNNSSTIYFITDTCTIKKNGTIPDNSILFNGKMNMKKVGAVLPDSYDPSLEDE